MPNKSVVLKLTYFWAFIEAGLGGLLHFLHIPITGFVVGGFAVVLIVLIAKYSKNNSRMIINALGVVLMIKFLLSPYSPYGAYIAVSFQGLLAALIFSTGRINLTISIFSILVMIESAIQKPLLAWLIMGNDFWKASILLMKNTFGLSLNSIENIAILLFYVYLLFYIIWGIIIALWAKKISDSIEFISINSSEIENLKKKILLEKESNGSRKFLARNIVFVTLLLIVVAAFLYTKLLSTEYLLRLLFVGFILFVLIPFLLKLYRKYLIKKDDKKLAEILNAIPEIKQNTIVAYELVKPIKSLKSIRDFMGYAIWLNVFYNEKQEL